MHMASTWRPAVAGLGLVIACGFTARAEDWPQFLGPQRNAVAPAAGLARSWPAAGPQCLWSAPLGAGFGGPAVADGKVYVLDREGEAKDIVRCLGLADGKEIWSWSYEAAGKFSYPGSRSTPTLDDQALYVVGPLGHVHRIDAATRQPTWSKHLIDDFGGKRPNWAISQSPLVVGDRVILAPQSPTAGVVAFEKVSGEKAWSSPPLGAMSYCSPVLARIGDVDQVVQISDKGTVSGIALDDGRILWQFKGWTCNIPIASPVVIDDGRLFISGEYGAGSVMIKVSADNGTFTATEVFRTQECMSQIHQPLLYKDHIYANSNGNKARDGFVCLDLKGALKWKTGDTPNYERGSVLLADGLIFAVNGRDGTLAIIEPVPTEFRLLASAKVLKGGQAWAPMAVVDGRLLVRDQQQLHCFDVAAKAP